MDRSGPYRVTQDDLEDGQAWVCGCGLSANKPWCDSSHKTARTEKPDAVYYYPGNVDENPRRELAPAQDPAGDETPDGPDVPRRTEKTEGGIP